MTTVEWGSEDKVKRVHESLLNLGLDEQHGTVLVPVGKTPMDYPPPFPVVTTALPIQQAISADGKLCDVFFWVSKEAWTDAGY